MGFKARAKTSSPKSIADYMQRIAAIVPKLYKAYEDYGVRKGMEPYSTFEEDLGQACTADDIDGLETFLGRSLPPSYRAFLSLYGGWLGVPGCGGADLLGPEAHRDQHVRNRLSWKSTMFDEFESANPIEAGAIPLAIGDDRNMFLLEPPVGADGEMAIVRYYLTGEEGRHANLLELFEHLLGVYSE